MKKMGFAAVAVLVLEATCLLVPTNVRTEDSLKKEGWSRGPTISKQQGQISENAVWLDPDSKGSFSVWGYLEEEGDWDYYSLICAEGWLEIYLESIPPTSDYDLYLFDCNWVVLDSSTRGLNWDEEIISYVTTDKYYIGVYCWSGGDTADSYHLYGTYVTPPALPDLWMQSLVASDSDPIIGDSITITLTVKNVGDTGSYLCYTDWHQNRDSPPGVPSTGDYYWWTYPLEPGSTAQFTHVVSNDQEEIWHMYGLTDSEGYNAEKNECNNVYGPVEVQWYGLPDLIVENVQVTDYSPFVDDYIDVTVTIRNNGGPAEDWFDTDLYYNLSAPPEPQTVGDRNFSKYGLGPDESYSCTFYNISTLSPGWWHMYVYVDSWLDIEEENENNNIEGPIDIFWQEYPISDDYGWPIHPSNQQDTITSTFMEYRSKPGEPYNHHFHDGIDIPAVVNTPVYSVSAGLTRFTTNMEGIYVDKFLYYHVDSFTISQTETWVNSDSLIAYTDTADHVHFNDGYNQQEVNPLREHGINPFDDNIDPTFYVDAVTLREDDPNVGGSEGGADGEIIQTDSVYGDVDIIVHVMDEINAGKRVGLYAISYQICDENCYPLTGEILNFQFDQWYGNYNVNFIYADAFYYIITNQITSNGYWRTTDFADGTYCLRISAYDIVSFYKKFVLEDTTKLNAEYYYLEDVELKNGGNHNPEIVGHLHCRFPQEECCNCIKPSQEITIQISAYDLDEEDTLRYEWYCWPGYGYFLPGGVDWIATEDSFVTYVTPSIPYLPNYKLWVYVYDNHEGWASLESDFDVYEEGYSCVCGDANNDGLVGAGDIVYLISYLHRGGPPPPDPYLRGDANNNCEVEPGDVVYLIAYCFRDGPPAECCWFPPN